VARLSAELYERKTGRVIDGVMYADPVAFANLLTVTGPVPVAGLPANLTAADAVTFLTRTQFSAFPDEQSANDAVTELVRDAFERFTQVPLPGPKQLSDLFRPAVLEGRLAFASLRGEDTPLLVALGLDGTVAVPTGGDVIGVVNRNANPSKIDAYLHRSTEVDVRWNPTTGGITETVRVTLRNDAPATGLPGTVLGNQSGFPSGTNVTDLIVLTGSQLDSVEVDGIPTEASPLLDDAHWRHTVRVALAPGQERVVTYQLSGAVDRGTTYSAFVVGQPLVNAGTITVRVAPTDGAVVPGRGITVERGVATIELGDARDTAISLRLRR
jgi:hypothetical protein